MKFNTTKFKINHIYKTTEQNDIDLTSKNSDLSSLPTKQNSIKNTHTLYDSDWIKALPVIDNIVPDIVDYNAYILTYPLGNGTTVENSLYPACVTYSFSQIVDISENLFPYINIDVLTKTYSDAQFLIPQYFSDYSQWGYNYYVLKGDSTTLYQGESPPNSYSSEYTSDEIDSGVTNWNLTSKWFEGDMFFNDGSNDKKINGKINSLKSYYNVVYVPEVDDYEYETFFAYALDSVSNSNFTGKGIHVKVTWTYNAGLDEWEKETITTKNTTKSVPYKVDTTAITMYGLLYQLIGGEYTFIGGGYYTITQTGTFSPASTNTIGTVDVNYLQNNRLFYSTDKAKPLAVNTSTKQFINIPVKSDYETNTLPYTKLYFEINNADTYPLANSVVPSLSTHSSKMVRYIKISENKYQIKVDGTLCYFSKANRASSEEFDVQDEEYSQVGSTYTRDSENRTTKNKNIYFAELFPIEVKLLITAKNLKNFKKISKYTK